MNKFIESIYTFNKLGGCSQDQSYKNFIGGVDLIEEETQELKDSLMDFLKNNEELTPDIKADALDAIVDLLVVTIGAGFRMGFSRQQLELAMSVITEQNMNKFVQDKEVAEESVKKYADDSRYKDVHCEDITLDNQTYHAIIGTTEKGGRKILKSNLWVDPKKMLKEICR